jgi:hypothetical protein
MKPSGTADSLKQTDSINCAGNNPAQFGLMAKKAIVWQA